MAETRPVAAAAAARAAPGFDWSFRPLSLRLAGEGLDANFFESAVLFDEARQAL
jgi:hypothetical protein